MATWIQSLSWTLIYATGQGLLVYSSLRLILKLSPAAPANARYYLSMSALAILLVWFGATWWQQYHMLAPVQQQLPATVTSGAAVAPQPAMGYVAGWSAHLSPAAAIFPWLASCYLLGLALMLVRLLAGMRHIVALRSSGTICPDATLSNLLSTLQQRMGSNAPVRLLVSARASVPMVIGFVKPVILLPVATVAHLSTDQLETILLHELAHLKRHDYIINILQSIAETILFFNPFVWLISGICRQEREHSCDDIVLQHTKEPMTYATALAALAPRRPDYPAVAVAATGEATHLYNRIRRIMEAQRKPYSYSRLVAAVLITAVIACSVAWLPIGDGAKNKPGATANTAQATAQKNMADLPQPEENVLIARLMTDHLIDQVNGFVVEKRQDRLYINGQQQPANIAQKYLAALTSDNIRIEVYPLKERMNQHRGGDFMQILLPVSGSSPCINTSSSAKPGC